MGGLAVCMGGWEFAQLAFGLQVLILTAQTGKIKTFSTMVLMHTYCTYVLSVYDLSPKSLYLYLSTSHYLFLMGETDL